MGTEASQRGGAGAAFARFVAAARAHPAVSLAVLIGGSAVLYVGVTALWPSDQRKIKATVDAVVTGLARGDADAVLSCVSPYFSEEGMDKRALRESLERILSRHPVRGVRVLLRQVKVTDGEAAASIYVQSVEGGTLGRSEWSVTFEELGGRWLVRRARPIWVRGRGVAGLRGVLGMGG